jgi:hypothetical protein
VLSASGVVLLGLAWLLHHLARDSDHDDTPLTWWHVSITAALFAAAAGLTAYMVW